MSQPSPPKYEVGTSAVFSPLSGPDSATAKGGPNDKSKSDKNSDDDVSKIGLKHLFGWATTSDKINYAIGGFHAAIFGASQPAICWIFGETFNAAQTSTPQEVRDDIQEMMWVFGVLGALNWYCGTIFLWTYDKALANQIYKIRCELFDLVIHQDIAWFDHRDPMTIPSMILVNTGKIKNALGKDLALAIQNGAQFLAGIIFAFIVSWKLSIMCCALLPVLGFSSYLFVTALSSISSSNSKFYIRAGAVADEIFGAIKTVVSFGAEDREMDRYGQFLDEARKGKASMGWRIGFQFSSMWSSIFFLYALTFWWSAILIHDGTINNRTGEPLNGGDVMNVFFCLLLGFFGIGQVAPWIKNYAESRPALKVIYDIRDIDRPLIKPGTVEYDRSSSSATSSSSSGQSQTIVQGENIRFTYPTRPDVPVLQDVSFDIKAGQKVAFVGESGSGKSTIIQLVERFYDIESGRLEINGVNIKDYSFKALGRILGYVQQEPVLFDSTIKENMCMGLDPSEQPSEDDMIAALKKAQVWDVIDGMPDKLNTRPGTGGGQFSGGQKQRMAIARALVRKPKILLLDEATSALDYESEKQVQNTIDNLTKKSDSGDDIDQITVLIVAHRLSTIRSADQIFFLNRGVIEESGTHDELVARKGGYFKLTETQNALSEAEGDDPEHSSLLGKKSSLSKDRQTSSQVPVIQGVVGTGSDDTVVMGISPEEERSSSKGGNSTGAGVPGSKTRVLSKGKSKEMALDNINPEFAALTKTEAQLEDERQAEIEKTYKVPMARLFKLNTKYELMFYPIGFMFSLANGSYNPLSAWFLISAIGDFYIPDREKMKEKVNESALIFVIIGLSCLATYTIAGGCYAYVGSWMTYRARLLVFRTLMSQEMAYFDAPENAPGKLTTMLDTQANDLSHIAGDSLGVKMEALSAIVCGITFAFFASWQVALVVTGCLPFVIVSMILVFALIMGMGGQAEDPEVLASGQIVAEGILNLKTVRALRCENDIVERYRAKCKTILEKDVKMAFKSGFAFGFSNGIIFAVYIIGFLYGSELLADGEIDAQDMFRAVMCVVFAGMGAGQAGSAMPNMRKATAACHDIFNLVDRVPSIDMSNEGNAKKVAISKSDDSHVNEIEFNKVEFAYPSRKTLPILRGVDLTFKIGNSIALAGPSGSGKSTIMSLLLRYYDADSGTVNINGIYNIQDLNIIEWRKLIGYVGQEPVLFNMSATDNLLYGLTYEERKKVSKDEMISVAKQANVNFIGGENQLGWDELLGPRGSKISGGQKQRLAIARALMRKPQILLLDEATSALDSVSEKEVQETLDKLAEENPNRITITIAHRLSTIQNCDRIEVMCDGKLLEGGSHAELIAKNGLYAKLASRGGGGGATSSPKKAVESNMD